ncbi:MAG: ATP synthase F1 subunit delta [Deltaproteobacteria bacterium]|nr:ATP synthase F1 subunit delta [Deltaproteobacteria bacterium]
MISLTLARKYARALLDIGRQEGNYEVLGKDLQKIADLLKENRELKGILLSAAYPAATRKAIVRAIGQPLGLSKSTVDFIELLIDRERMDHFAEIVRSYESLCDGICGRIRATLVTAVGLPPELVRLIKAQLESKIGKEVVLSVEENPSLIGGVLTRIGNVIYDGSLKTQLLRVKESLSKE